ncbi:MAG: hypothetical protein H8E31_03095 [Planctomycetes bacterium]|nr:hypothetical protein [Planctomycetota bacterium]
MRATPNLGVVNPSLRIAEVVLELRGAVLAGTGTAWRIGGTDPQAHNDPDGPRPVQIEEFELQGVGEQLRLAPCSVTLYAFDLLAPAAGRD